MANWFNVGKIVNTHGIHGEVRVISKTDFPEERYAVGNQLMLFLQGKQEPIALTVRSYRRHKNFDLLMFEGYTNINMVESWKNSILKVSAEQLGELPSGEYYFHEIIGCDVITNDNRYIGVVKEILTPGANDVWVVKSESGKEILIPYIADVVIDISINEKKIIIEPMVGLIE
ncbi:ribosome maturation factor RimM [Bacillus sp. FJAT-50079]|uniref:ribosome maturation factor RimM n=1 Tax=Bacillus sp. FJAT-50079 TaxID=2833577 RepID=UPI001BCA63E6|nr:ribosome maturation factor RimM [Bacillus sp. FJAT-50079]MBS4207647.1 ribosome maturation factor RimM [Bacillus sp. FJAT-50079]